MTDVIFNGSGTRKPVGQASVELLFDNIDHKLTGEYANFTEVSIKRKVERDGTATYSLNGTKCRRKDITDIFLGTGLGPRSYSIIEQGMISRLIESKPEELRIFIEEAAGISKYKERRKETESRIKRTRENLERLTDIRDELERQLQHLQRQSVAAEKYGEYKQQERQMQANVNALRWRALDESLKQQQQITRALELSIEAANTEHTAIDAKVEKHLSDNADLTDALSEVQARFYGLGNDIARLEQSIEHNLERIDQLKQDLRETEEAWEHTKEEMDVDLQKVTALDAEKRSIEPELELASTDAAGSDQELAKVEQAMNSWQQAWEAFNQRAEEPRQIAEVEQSRIQQLESIVERGLERKERLQKEQEVLAKEPADANIKSLSSDVTVIEQEIGQQQTQSKTAAGEIETLRRQDQSVSGQLDQVRGALQTALGRQASLEALQQAALGRDDTPINSWLKQKGLDNSIRLGETVKVQPGWEAAVEVVLGDSLQAVCVESVKDIASLAKSLPDGMLTIMETGLAGPVAGTAKAELLVSKISSDWDLITLLPGIYAVDTVEQALLLRKELRAGESVVCKSGVWIGASWIRSRKAADSQAGLLQRKGQLSSIESVISELKAKSDALLKTQLELRGRLKETESQRETLHQQLNEKSRKFSELKSQLSGRLVKVEQVELRRERIGHELDELARQLTTEEENIAASRARLQEALDNMEQDINQRDKLEKERVERRRDLENTRIKASKNKEIAHQLALRQQSVAAQLKSTRETMDRMASQVQRSRERMDSLSRQIKSADEPLATMRSELENLLEKRLEVEKQLAAAKARVDENEHTIRSLDQERNQVEKKLTGLREEMMENRLKSEGASVKKEGLIEQLRGAKFNVEEVLAQIPAEMDEPACDAELERIGNRIQRLGPINLAAIDEYKQQSERKNYLDAQNADLEKALATLQNAIRKIDKETRQRFKDTFDTINDGLQKLFPRVFGGGHAYLDMTGEDLLDTGVAIMARPPGKRNSTIHLLSGGEKAMTAIALVFSIFQLNPSPFCMLDEVDAPLDDANVGRYANLVKEMSKNVQFIFITHNKITMEMANQLLG
ncbi:MAG: chromosome segregation protein SMC, partial [Pseudohongiellaceae bacterium]